MKKGPSLDIDLGSIGPKLSRFLYRFHVVLFVVIVIGGMAIVMFLLNQSIIKATDTTDVIAPVAQPFDQDTIDRLNQLDDANNSSSIDFPDGRINPFSE